MKQKIYNLQLQFRHAERLYQVKSDKKNSKAGSEIQFYRKYSKRIQTPELLGINYAEILQNYQ